LAVLLEPKGRGLRGAGSCLTLSVMLTDGQHGEKEKCFGVLHSHMLKRAAKPNELNEVKGPGCGKMALCNPRARRIASEAGGIPADAEVRRQLNRMLEGGRMKGSTNRAMVLQYVVAKGLEGQELSADIIG
jgi:hypothetical protein